MKKYALAGCSGRAIGMFAKPIEEKFSKYARLVGMFDPNHKRMEFYNHRLKTPVPTYTDFRKMSINGTKGRLEVEEYHSGSRLSDAFNYIRYFNRKGRLVTYKVAKSGGGHGGGDERLRRMLFVGDLSDPLGLMADSRAGAMSILTGIAANKSINAGKAVKIAGLLAKKKKI